VAAVCTAERYAVAVADTRLFLEGRNQELAEQLRERMLQASAAERFEEAAQLRDAMRTVDAVQVGASGAVVQIFIVRGGRVIERAEFVWATEGTENTRATEGTEGTENARATEGTESTEITRATESTETAETDRDVIEAAIQQYYVDQEPPPEIHAPTAPREQQLLEDWLGQKAGRKVRIVVPQRGTKKGMMELAHRNAALAYRQRFDASATANYDALELLQSVLRLPKLPRRIDCFDISTIQGSETVASMVVCVEGRMRPSEYRKFKIKHGSRIGDQGSVVPGSRLPVPGGFLDDFAAMEQVVRRRYARVLENGGPFPDLIVIDGGKGQLNAAYAALEQVGLSNLVAVGLAKKEELIFTRDSMEPLALDPRGSALRLLQRIRDEAHRFAITFHRQSRKQRDLQSELDVVPGIGLRRRKTLLTAFGSLSGVRRASREELARVVGGKAADAVIAHFAANP
jgi:excinuclease ABC subunit C